jgi:hypothetical protein
VGILSTLNQKKYNRKVGKDFDNLIAGIQNSELVVSICTLEHHLGNYLAQCGIKNMKVYQYHPNILKMMGWKYIEKNGDTSSVILYISFWKHDYTEGDNGKCIFTIPYTIYMGPGDSERGFTVGQYLYYLNRKKELNHDLYPNAMFLNNILCLEKHCYNKTIFGNCFIMKVNKHIDVLSRQILSSIKEININPEKILNGNFYTATNAGVDNA